MPIYEYQCGKCGTFEITQRITKKSLSRCPTCKSKVKKLISNTSFQLKGTGWYVTDYARKDQSSSSKGEKSDKSESASGEGAKSEGAKTDSAKSETKESTAKADKGTDTTKSTPKTDTK